MNIYQKLVEVRKVVPYLQKENKGSQYAYVSSSQVLGNCKAKMDELGLLIIPKVLSHNVRESAIETYDSNGRVTKRTITYFTELEMEFTWVNAENPEEKIVCTWYGQGVDIAGEKGVGKAMTYSEKYFMLKFFNIATDKDDPDAFQKKHEDEEIKASKTTQKDITPNKLSEQKERSQENKTITSEQAKRLFAISKNEQLVRDIIGKYKYNSTKDITIYDYDHICQELEATKKKIQ